MVLPNSANEEIKYIAFSPATKAWVILYGLNGFWLSGLAPATLLAELERIQTNGWILRNVAFTPTGAWTVLFQANNLSTMTHTAIPPAAVTATTSIYKQGWSITQMEFAPDGSWYILYGNNGYWFS